MVNVIITAHHGTEHEQTRKVNQTNISHITITWNSKTSDPILTKFPVNYTSMKRRSRDMVSNFYDSKKQKVNLAALVVHINLFKVSQVKSTRLSNR